MRKMASREAVFEAAAQLRREGQEPSSRNVRNYIGGGSLATIQRYLREWRHLEEEGNDGPSGSFPQASPAPFAQTAPYNRLVEESSTKYYPGNRSPAYERHGPGSRALTAQDHGGDERINALIQAVVGLRADIAANSGLETKTENRPDDRIEALTKAVADLRHDFETASYHRESRSEERGQEDSLKIAVEVGQQIGALQNQVEGLSDTLQMTLADVRSEQDRPDAQMGQLLAEVSALRHDFEQYEPHEQLKAQLDARAYALQEQISQLQNHLEQALEQQSQQTGGAQVDGRIDQLLKAVIGLRADFESILAKQVSEVADRSDIRGESDRRLDDVQAQIASLRSLVQQALTEGDDLQDDRIDGLTRAVIGLRADFEHLVANRHSDSEEATAQIAALDSKFEVLGEGLRHVMAELPQDGQAADHRIDDLIRAVVGLRTDFEIATQKAESQKTNLGEDADISALGAQLSVLRGSLEHALEGGFAEIIAREIQARDNLHVQAAAESERRAEQLQTQLDHLRESLDGALSGGLVTALTEAMEARAAERESAMMEAESRLHSTMIDQYQTVRQALESLRQSLDHALEQGVGETVTREISRGIQGLQEGLERTRARTEADLRTLRDQIGDRSEAQIAQLAEDFRRLEDRLNRLTEEELPEALTYLAKQKPASDPAPAPEIDVEALAHSLKSHLPKAADPLDPEDVAKVLVETLPKPVEQPGPEMLDALREEVMQLKGVMSSVIALVSRQDDPVAELVAMVQALRDESLQQSEALKRGQKQAADSLQAQINALALKHEARLAATSEERVDKVLTDIESMQTDLKMASMSMKPLQQELRRLTAERDSVVADRGRSEGERDAAVAERDRMMAEMASMKTLMADMQQERDRARALAHQAAEENGRLRKIAGDHKAVPQEAAAGWTAEALQYEGLSTDQLTDQASALGETVPGGASASAVEDVDGDFVAQDDSFDEENDFEGLAALGEEVPQEGADSVAAPHAPGLYDDHNEGGPDIDDQGDEWATLENDDFGAEEQENAQAESLYAQETNASPESQSPQDGASQGGVDLAPHQQAVRQSLLSLIQDDEEDAPSDVALAALHAPQTSPTAEAAFETQRVDLADDPSDDIAAIAEAGQVEAEAQDLAVEKDDDSPEQLSSVAEETVPDDVFPEDSLKAAEGEKGSDLADSDFVAMAEEMEEGQNHDSPHPGLSGKQLEEDVSFSPDDFAGRLAETPEPALEDEEPQALILSETLSDQGVDFDESGDIHPLAEKLEQTAPPTLGSEDDFDFEDLESVDLEGSFEKDTDLEFDEDDLVTETQTDQAFSPQDTTPFPEETTSSFTEDRFLAEDPLAAPTLPEEPAFEATAPEEDNFESKESFDLEYDDDEYEDDSDIADDDFMPSRGANLQSSDDDPLNFNDFEPLESTAKPAQNADPIAQDLLSNDLSGDFAGFLEEDDMFPEDPGQSTMATQSQEEDITFGEEDLGFGQAAQAPEEPFLGFDLESEEAGLEDENDFAAPPPAPKRIQTLDDVFSDLR